MTRTEDRHTVITDDDVQATLTRIHLVSRCRSRILSGLNEEELMLGYGVLTADPKEDPCPSN